MSEMREVRSLTDSTEREASFAKAIQTVTEKAREHDLGVYLWGDLAAALYGKKIMPDKDEVVFFVDKDDKKKAAEAFEGSFYRYVEGMCESDKFYKKMPDGFKVGIVRAQHMLVSADRPTERVIVALDDDLREDARQQDFNGEPVMVMSPEAVLLAKLFLEGNEHSKGRGMANYVAMLQRGIIDYDKLTRLVRSLANGNDDLRSILIRQLENGMRLLQIGLGPDGETINRSPFKKEIDRQLRSYMIGEILIGEGLGQGGQELGHDDMMDIRDIMESASDRADEILGSFSKDT